MVEDFKRRLTTGRCSRPTEDIALEMIKYEIARYYYKILFPLVFELYCSSTEEYHQL